VGDVHDLHLAVVEELQDIVSVGAVFIDERLTFLRPDMRSCMKVTVQSFSGGRYTWATEEW